MGKEIRFPLILDLSPGPPTLLDMVEWLLMTRIPLAPLPTFLYLVWVYNGGKTQPPSSGQTYPPWLEIFWKC